MLSALLRALCVGLTLLSSFSDATQVMHRPERYNDIPSVFLNQKMNATSLEHHHRRANGKVSFAYFTNWGIYGANFQPTDIVAGPLTHILYSFGDTDASTGQIKLTDSYADQEKHFPDDSWSETGNNLYGCLKQLYKLKLQKRNLKVLLSIGGWTYSQAGHFNFVTSSSARTNFVNDALKLVEDYGFDGIDLDYEYPTSPELAQGFADLLTALRKAFDDLAKRKGDSSPYLVTAAVPAGPANYAYLKVSQMNAALDYWNLMAYDYAGSWTPTAEHQANVYGGERTGFNTENAINFYVSNGASPSKMVLGMPLYGRAFEDTAGLGQPYQGIGPGTIEAGIYSYKTLPFAGAQIMVDSANIASYSYDSSKKEFVSYDTPDIVKKKVAYLQSKGLAGSMFWELSTDKVGSDSLVQTSANALGSLDSTPNHINYPSSKWDNIRNNMSGSPAPSSSYPAPTYSPTSPPTSSVPPTTAPAPTSSSPSGGSCGGVAAWSSSVAYGQSGTLVTYGGHLWANSWWTQADVPGGPAGVWVDKGAC